MRHYRFLCNFCEGNIINCIEKTQSLSQFRTMYDLSFHVCCRTPNCDVYLTHWGRVTHICVSKLTIIGSDSGLSPGRRQAIIWISAIILLIGFLGTNFSHILIRIQTFSFKKMQLKSSAKWRPFCPGLNVTAKTEYFRSTDVSRWCQIHLMSSTWVTAGSLSSAMPLCSPQFRVAESQFVVNSRPCHNTALAGAREVPSSI